MVWGIVTAVLYLLVGAVFITNRTPFPTLKKVFSALHKPLGCILVCTAAVHFLLTLKLFEQRPIAVYIFGGLTALSAMTAAAAILLRKKIRNAFLIHKIAALAMLIFMLPHIFFCISSMNTYVEKINQTTVSNLDISSLSDGEYIGEYDVEYIYAKVMVTVDKGKIANIELLEHRNERGKAGEKVIDRIYDQQKIDVDTITGATNSSKVIKKAVENALTINGN